MSESDRKQVVKITHSGQIYVHNDLLNTAYYFHKRINDRLKNEDYKGVGLEMIAGVTMIAFAMEAAFNFYGFKTCGEKWNEWEKPAKKVKQVFDALKIETDEAARPYSSIAEVREVRNLIAHGKPEEFEFTETAVMTLDEIETPQTLSSAWNGKVCITNLNKWYEDLCEIDKLLRKASGLDILAVSSGGMRKIQFVRRADEEQPAAKAAEPRTKER